MKESCNRLRKVCTFVLQVFSCEYALIFVKNVRQISLFIDTTQFVTIKIAICALLLQLKTVVVHMKRYNRKNDFNDKSNRSHSLQLYRTRSNTYCCFFGKTYLCEAQISAVHIKRAQVFRDSFVDD